MATELRDILSKRYAVLQSLAEAPKTKSALDDDLDDSRSTINRAVRELLDSRCIEPTKVGERTYRLTAVGQIGLDIESTYRDSTNRLTEFGGLLNNIPSDLPVSDALVAEAEIHYSPRTPDIAFRPGTELLSDADRMRGTATVVREEYFESLQKRLESGKFQLELVLESELLNAIRSNYEEEFIDLQGRDAVDMYVTEKALPYALWLIEQDDDVTAGITIHEEGGVKGTIVNESESAVRWLKSQYMEFREEATHLS